jgi:hypothetical protein
LGPPPPLPEASVPSPKAKGEGANSPAGEGVPIRTTGEKA